MRKIITIAVICLMLCGCSNGHDANITNDSDIIWSSDNQTYTSKDLNELLKYQDYSIVLLNNILTKIGELEGIDVDTYLKETEDTVNMYVEQGLVDQLIAYYGSVNNYKSLLIIDSIVTDLYDKVANEKYDEYKESNPPYKAEIAYFDDIEKAKNVVNSVKNNEHTFAFACEENGYTQTVTAAIYTDQSDLPVEVKSMALNTTETGVTDPIQSSTYITDDKGESTITPRYYVINIISKDADEFKDEFIQYIKDSLLDSNTVVGDYMRKYDLKVYDQRTYELLKQNYGDFK